jgi:hypothetical protein
MLVRKCSVESGSRSWSHGCGVDERCVFKNALGCSPLCGCASEGFERRHTQHEDNGAAIQRTATATVRLPVVL